MLDTSGSWTTDPSDPDAPDPSACALVGTTLLNCQRNENLDLIAHGPPRTTLSRAAVERLGVGRRVRVSGTMVTSHDQDDDEVDEHHRGKERFHYTITVKRVR